MCDGRCRIALNNERQKKRAWGFYFEIQEELFQTRQQLALLTRQNGNSSNNNLQPNVQDSCISSMELFSDFGFRQMLETTKTHFEVNGFDGEVCCICFDDYETEKFYHPDDGMMILPCGHRLHWKCVRGNAERCAKKSGKVMNDKSNIPGGVCQMECPIKCKHFTTMEWYTTMNNVRDKLYNNIPPQKRMRVENNEPLDTTKEFEELVSDGKLMITELKDETSVTNGPNALGINYCWTKQTIIKGNGYKWSKLNKCFMKVK